MKISGEMPDRAVLKELGSRIAHHRLNRNLTQARLARQAGVSTATVQRIEYGQSTQASNLIRILRALKLLENLDVLMPEPAISPIQQVRMRGKPRQRASSPSDPPEKAEHASDWTWGDEQ